MRKATKAIALVGAGFVGGYLAAYIIDEISERVQTVLFWMHFFDEIEKKSAEKKPVGGKEEDMEEMDISAMEQEAEKYAQETTDETIEEAFDEARRLTQV